MGSPRVSHLEDPCCLRPSGAKRSQLDYEVPAWLSTSTGPGPPEDLPLATPFVVYLGLSDADLARRVRSPGGCGARAVPVHICHRQRKRLRSPRAPRSLWTRLDVSFALLVYCCSNSNVSATAGDMNEAVLALAGLCKANLLSISCHHFCFIKRFIQPRQVLY
ncbi:uncharacterized protein LOC134775965 [Penaeus indicus]|uniref:uncharacterized protein LOC134775965 n=1 Tax=Penaeus indicus TaxID=29960 RepID=UPI00300C38D5